MEEEHTTCPGWLILALWGPHLPLRVLGEMATKVILGREEDGGDTREKLGVG